MHYARVLVFGAHPDDALRMAPSMARMSAEGTQVTAVIFTDGCEGFPDPAMKDTIVATRARESKEAQEVLGVANYVNLDIPDMGIENTKATLKRVIKAIRDARPQAIFTHGEHERHRDHLATHAITLEATWHAGQPVSTDLGPPWNTPHIYYYKNTAVEGPVVEYDVTAYVHKHAEANATQVSQHVLFRRSRQSFLDEAERLKANPPRTLQRFTIHPWTVLNAFPPLP